MTLPTPEQFFELKNIEANRPLNEEEQVEFDRIIQMITTEIENAIKDDTVQLPSIHRQGIILANLSENSAKKVNNTILDKLRESGWRFDNNPDYPRITLQPLYQSTTR